jgi:hypothetical protein
MLQRLDRSHAHKVTLDWPLGHYREGWAEVDPDKIFDATAPDYCFHDPLVGSFSRSTLTRYFAAVTARMARAGGARRQDLAFFLHGPLAEPTPTLRFWREAPRIGLTGVSEVIVGPAGIIAERVNYDLTLASELLRREC